MDERPLNAVELLESVLCTLSHVVCDGEVRVAREDDIRFYNCWSGRGRCREFSFGKRESKWGWGREERTERVARVVHGEVLDALNQGREAHEEVRDPLWVRWTSVLGFKITVVVEWERTNLMFLR